MYIILFNILYFILYNIQGETELSFRLIPSLTQSHTKPCTKTVREKVTLAKEDNSVSPCTMQYTVQYTVQYIVLFTAQYAIIIDNRFI